MAKKTKQKQPERHIPTSQEERDAHARTAGYGTRMAAEAAERAEADRADWQDGLGSERVAALLAAATVTVGDDVYMKDGRGRMVPVALVPAKDQLQDEMVRTIVGHAKDLSEQIGRFRGHTMDDIGGFDALLEAEYGGHSRQSVKGNRTYMSHDGCYKVQVQISETVAFGPELQVARDLVDECLAEWAADSRAEIRALVEHAFQTDKEGEISRGSIYSLLRLDIEDPRWRKGMEALRDAMRVVGSKSYVRIYERETPEDGWQPVTIDLAKAA